MKEIGLFGYGNFGKLVYEMLKNYFKINIYDINTPDNDISYSSLEICASRKIIILAVPVQNIKDLLLRISPFIQKNTLVFDVSSVKVKPVKLMTDILPEDCQIIGTHPLFGPESIKQNKNDLRIALCPVRTNQSEIIKNFMIENLKLKIITCTPEEHDKQMAPVQGITHFIGKVLNEMDLPDSEFKTLAYIYLLKIKKIVKTDSPALFETIQNENDFAGDIRKEIMTKLIELDRILRSLR